MSPIQKGIETYKSTNLNSQNHRGTQDRTDLIRKNEKVTNEKGSKKSFSEVLKKKLSQVQ